MNELRGMIERHLLVMWRYRWVAVGLAWLLCLGGWIGTRFIPNQYESNARIYVDADAVLTPLLHGLALDDSPTTQVEMVQRTLLSRPNLAKLVSKTGLDLTAATPEQREALITRLGTDIKIAPQTRNLFTITYRNTNPQLAYDVVQNILDLFIEEKTGANRTDMSNAQDFLQAQIAAYETKLRDAEKKRAEFRTKYVDLLPDSNGGASRLDAARAAAQDLQGRLIDAQSKLSTLSHELGTTPPMLVTENLSGAPSGTAGNSALEQAVAHLRELQQRDTDQHPDVVAAKQRVAALQGMGSGAPASGAGPARSRSQPNPVYEQLKVRLVDTTADVASLQRQVAEALKERDRLETIARTVPGVQAEYVNLDRDYDILRKSYDDLLGRREQIRLSAAADTNADKVKMRIVDPPQVPQNAVAPNRALLLSGVLLFGLGGGVGVAFVLSQLDRSFHTVHDLADYGLPIAGVISVVGAAVSIYRRIFQISSVVIAVLLLCVAYGGLLYRLLQSTGSA